MINANYLKNIYYIVIVIILASPWIVNISLGTAHWAIQSIVTGFAVIVFVLYQAGLTLACKLEACAKLLAWSLLVAAVLNSALGLWQITAGAQGYGPWLLSADGVAYGNLGQRNLFASLTVFGYLALAYLTSTSYLKLNQRGFGVRICVWLALGLLVVGNAASTSRTGVLTLTLACSMLWLWRKNDSSTWQGYIWGTLPLYAIASWALWLGGWTNMSGFARLAHGDEGCSGRLTLWRNVVELISVNPWTGWGWGELSFAHFDTLYSGARFCAILDNAHNLPLHIAVTLGIPVASVICAGIAYWLWSKRPWADSLPARQMAWALLAILALHSLLELPLWSGPFQAVGLAALFLLSCRAPSDSIAVGAGFTATHNDQTRQYYSLIAYGLFSSIMFIFLLYAAWDYHRVSQVYLQPELRSEKYRAAPLLKARGTVLFRNNLRFALLAAIPLNAETAKEVNSLAKEMLHFSPDALVVQKLLNSALLLGKDDEVRYYLKRFAAAYPRELKEWALQFEMIKPIE